jgi:DUF1680 family protein
MHLMCQPSQADLDLGGGMTATRSGSSTAGLGRREVLTYSAAAGLAAAAVISADSALRAAPSVASEVVAPEAWDLNPFALADVELRESVFTRKRDLMLGYARGYDVDRLLSVFRANAGLSTAGAVAPGGWEGLDGEANGNLRGHYGGHFLSMLAQAYASDGEPVFDAKLTQMVAGLHDCREALRRDDPWVLSVPGRFGKAVESVRGSYQYLTLPASTTAGLTDFTLSVWVRPTRDQSWARIFEAGNSTSRYLFLTQRNQNGVPRFCLTTNGGGAEQGVNGNAPLPMNTWTHVAVTLAGTTCTLYVNGTAVGTNAAMTLNPNALGPLTDHWLGRSHYASDPLYVGGLDELNIYSRALTATEVAALQTDSVAATPVGRGDRVSYDFDDVDTATVADASGGGRHATAKRTWGKPSHPGYLAAYPETQFITLESMTAGNYTVVWAPYYTAHKILKGLLDAHLNSDDAVTRDKALDLASGLCDWMHARLSVLTETVRQRMWGIFSSGEYGGLVEAIVDTWTITQKPEHLQLARYFDLNRLIDACVADQDILDGMHGNQHIPIFNGLVRLHDATGEERYLTAARNFWPMVAEHRTYAIGGTTQAEFWRARDAIASTLTADNNAETCCAHNMLKLSRLLFFHEQDPRYMEFYERTLFNQVLGSKQDSADGEYPLATYFIGLAPGAVRDYTPKAGTTCCEGTGMESATKYQDSIYFKAADDSALWVNLFSASRLDWSSRGVTVTQTTGFPVEQGTTLTIGGSGAFALRIRRPSWARTGYAVRLNGAAVDAAEVAPGSYLTIDRSWSDGDVVQVDMPFTLRMEATPDDRALRALFYGPIHIGARAGGPQLTFSLDATTRLSGDLGSAFRPVEGEPLRFTHAGTELVPFLEGTTDPFHSYVRNVTQRVVLGDVDSGVGNIRGADGATILDEIWAAAPFDSKADFVEHVRTVAMGRRVAGDINSADLQRLLLAAGKARVQA